MGDQNSWQWHCFRAKHLYLHIFKTDICRYINIWHISELRIFGSICPCYETRAIFSGGIWLDTVKHWLEIRAGQRRYLSTISTSSERFYLRGYGLWSRARIDSCLIVGSVEENWWKTRDWFDVWLAAGLRLKFRAAWTRTSDYQSCKRRFAKI